MRKKISCIAISMILFASTVTQGSIQNKLMDVNTADKVLKSSTFTIDKAAAKKIVQNHNKKAKLTKVEKYKNIITHLGIVSSNNEDDFVKIKKQPKEKIKSSWLCAK